MDPTSIRRAALGDPTPGVELREAGGKELAREMRRRWPPNGLQPSSAKRGKGKERIMSKMVRWQRWDR